MPKKSGKSNVLTEAIVENFLKDRDGPKCWLDMTVSHHLKVSAVPR